ncbi:MAG: hypothetical protein U1C53_02855, partial [Candidatus Veblenbacteria bacterium]|nr:hypothetical protein [Candidatus Veblenbacteria bacterium]
GSSDNTESVNVLPNVAKDNATVSARLTHITTTELKVEEQHPVYTIQGTRAAKLLFFIPVSVKTVAKINATSGGVVSIQKPWWSFLAR